MPRQEDLFIEKYRPKTLEDIILPDRILNMFKGHEDNLLQQHYLFHSASSGVGKSSLAHILSDNYHTLYLDISTNPSVEIIRNDITDFANKNSLSGGYEQPKLIILDEMDGASSTFFDSLRGISETLSDRVRFIGTCNHIEKVPNPIQSRFELVDFDPIDSEEKKELLKKHFKRIYYIIKKEGMDIDKDILKNLVIKTFPDFRKIINKIQTLKRSGVTDITIKDFDNLKDKYEKLYELIFSNTLPDVIFTTITRDFSSNPDDILKNLGDEFIKWIISNKRDSIVKIPKVMEVVMSHQANRKHVLDSIGNLINCVFLLNINLK